MKPFFIFTCCMAIVLSGCQSYTPKDVASASDKGLCSVFWDSQFNRQVNYDAKTNELINQEVLKRKLDCDPDNHTCLSYGHKHGSKGYTDCRMKLRQMAEERQQLGEIMNGLKEIQATPTSSEVTIRNNPYPFVHSIR